MLPSNMRNGLQAPPELLDWMRKSDFKPAAVAAVASMSREVSPTLANAQANVDALRRLLHTTDAQVCPAALVLRAMSSCGYLSMRARCTKRYVLAVDVAVQAGVVNSGNVADSRSVLDDIWLLCSALPPRHQTSFCVVALAEHAHACSL